MSKDKDAIARASAQPRTITLTLEEPIQRGDTAITSVILTEPRGGALRGLNMLALVRDGSIDEYRKLTPRISSPQITEADFAAGNVSAADLLGIVNEVGSFFISKKLKKEHGLEE